MVLREIRDIVADYSGCARTVLEYSLVMKRLVDEAKQPTFSVASWGPLAAYVAVDEFERVGNFMEVMRWPDYVAFLTRWASSSEWECSFKRIAEKDRVVYLELEERSQVGAHHSVVNSTTVNDFNAEGKLAHLGIFLQMQIPDPEMLKAYKA